ncbi:MAG: UDP-N-acetylmuramoyl-L-alanyl-D-glutamate--2,6-diaminopimelate ligase [Bernardetiaceae bacterium]
MEKSNALSAMQPTDILLEDLAVVEQHGPLPERITGLYHDSRKLTLGGMFFALPGTQQDGHQYIPQAKAAGAALVIGEQPYKPEWGVPYLRVSDVQAFMGQVAHRYHGRPSGQLQLVGITGTNGKTTVATLLYHLFRALGYNTGLIATTRYCIHDTILPSTHTTPDALDLHALLARMVAARCTHVFMEVSSHAIVQQRIAGAVFAGGVFTNISHDHLDFHKTFAAYIAAKKKFFDDLPSTAFALTNKDDKRGLVMLQNCSAQRKFTFAQKFLGHYQFRILENTLEGLYLQIQEQTCQMRLVGAFNAYNLTAAYAVADQLGQDGVEVLTLLSGLGGVDGRLERVLHPRIFAFVDYAHTPDALQNVLETLQVLRHHPGQRILTVFGCGGNRDREKRPLMAKIAEKYSDRIFLTSDNPRNEAPEDILDQIAEGFSIIGHGKAHRITDRREAIEAAVAVAQPQDLILVAGKGHETYQEIAGQRLPFDDRLILRAALEKHHP